jgi:endoglucanase
MGALLAGAMLIGRAEALPMGPDANAAARPAAAQTSEIIAEASRAWFRREWDDYKARFVSPDGRVIDNANGGVSHSEGQGYALLLAVGAGDEASFATIWRWTADNLQKRRDALLAWQWDPRKKTVGDINNATDGDILVTWALARAAKRFGRRDYEAAARRIAQAVVDKVLVAGKAGPLLLPGQAGFDAKSQPDGPVVNLSYWVFPAFHDLAELAPEGDWKGLRRRGLDLVRQSHFGPSGLPANWTSAAGDQPAPARNFPAEFGYDAIRIPLYLAWDPDLKPELLAPFAQLTPGVTDLGTGSARQAMDGAGYRLITALARCATSGERLPAELLSSRDDLYYPESLRLLSMMAIQERFPQCL